MASAFEALHGALVEHLDEEEREILPLAARNVRQQEWDELGEHGVKDMRKKDLPIMFGAVAEEATPRSGPRSSPSSPRRSGCCWKTVFAWQYRRYVSRVRDAR